MQKFSKEIFIAIISYLQLNDKLQCILVCKQWKNLIQDTILYRELSFFNTDTFNRAFEFFTDKSKFGEQVRQLQIQDCEPDTFTLLSLPDVFSNLTKLIWISQLGALKTNLPRKPIYIQQFKKWNQLQHIQSLTSKYNYLNNYILESSHCSQLTTLDIQFTDSSNLDEPEKNLYSSNNFIKSLKNVPSLLHLTLGNFPISPEVITRMQDELPNVNTLILKSTSLAYFHLSSINRNVQPKNLQHLRVSFNPIEDYGSKEKFFAPSIRRFLSFISSAYKSLQTLSIEFDDEYQTLPPTCSLEGDIINILSNLKHLTCYKMRVYPITDMILSTMDENQLKLETIQIWLDEYDMRRQFQFILSSQQKNSIKDLKIVDTVQTTRNIPNDSTILNLITQLSNLTILDLRCRDNLKNYSFDLVLNILNQLDKLDSLCIQSVYYDPSSTENSLDKHQIKQTKISCLKLTIAKGCLVSQPNHINAIFQYILLACPHLKIINLFGMLSIENLEGISLDFTHHKQLKEIKILMDNVSYYTFDKVKKDEPIIPYKNIGQQMDLELSAQFKKTFYIELLWDQCIVSPYLIDATLISSA